MVGRRLQELVRCLRRTAAERTGGEGVSDARLLARFATDRDEAAFELLVWRHGGMVLGVCRSVLRHEQDAEDAFQATFLVLARKAGSLGRSESVGGWLYRVARRVALRVRNRADSRKGRERPLEEAVGCEPGPLAEAVGNELRGALDEEVSRLPGSYREAFVLCCLSGLSNAEAARELGCAVGTVESRLSRARQRLKAALARRGLDTPAGLLAGLSGLEAGSALPAELMGATARAATQFAMGNLAATGVSSPVIALTRCILEGMLMTRLKLIGVAVLVVALACGVGVERAVRPAVAADPPAVEPAREKPAGPESELERLRRENKALKREIQDLKVQAAQLKADARALATEAQRQAAAAQAARQQAEVATRRALVERDRAEQEALRQRRLAAENRALSDRRTRLNAQVLNDVEAALKALKAAGDPGKATEALERAVRRLKGKE